MKTESIINDMTTKLNRLLMHSLFNDEMKKTNTWNTIVKCSLFLRIRFFIVNYKYLHTGWDDFLNRTNLFAFDWIDFWNIWVHLCCLKFSWVWSCKIELYHNIRMCGQSIHPIMLDWEWEYVSQTFYWKTDSSFHII